MNERKSAMKIQEYEKRCQDSSQKYQSYTLKSNQLSVVRFILFIMVLLFLLLGYFQKLHFLYMISFICFIVFLFMVSIHNKVKKEVHYYHSLYQVYQEHIQRMNNQWDQFEEDGHEFLNSDVSTDLDLFGHHSLFQFINATFTFQGKERLAKDMIHHNLSQEIIIERQKSLQELSQHEDMFIQLQVYGKMMKLNDEKIVIQFIDSLTKQHYQNIPTMIFILPIITCLSLILASFSIALPYSYVLCEGGVILQLIITCFFFKQHAQMFEPVYALHKSLKSYYQLFQMISKEEFETSLLIDIQNKIVKNNHALKAIEQLSKISQAISYRKNIFVFILFNAFGLYDLFLRFFYLQWISQYGIEMQQWIDALTDMELLMSLCIPKMDDFDVTQPSIVDEMNLSFHQLKHPLIHTEKVVGNSFELEKQVCVITGSNMSGKTTFMRTIGLNLVLAYMGGYIFGEAMTCSCMKIFTSMRVRDNVEEGISTFYGELLRIKEMIEYSQQNKPMICFVDEIFKGTNSMDRIAGAKATIQKLSVSHCLLFITTHDFELCQSQDIDISNYHFDEYYQDSKIYFDYLIHKGQSQSTNGQFLLKQLGII